DRALHPHPRRARASFDQGEGARRAGLRHRAQLRLPVDSHGPRHLLAPRQGDGCGRRPDGAPGPGDRDAAAHGMGCARRIPGRMLIAGACCQPWLPNVVFTPIPPERFAAYAEPDRVKIAWTLETEPLGTALTQFSTETRAVATDDQARAKFRRYW